MPVLRSEMEEQVLGKVSRDHLLWIGQCDSAQVSLSFSQRLQSHRASQNTATLANLDQILEQPRTTSSCQSQVTYCS